MKKLQISFLIVFLFSSISHADILGKLGFFASLNGTGDFVEFKKPDVESKKHEGIGFGLAALIGMRFGSFLAIAPFGMFTSISDSSYDNISYLLSGYGGEAKIRFAPINIKGGYGLYQLKEKVAAVETDYSKGVGWHASIGFEALLAPGLTIFIDAKYRALNFKHHSAELVSTSGAVGVTSYF
jgi:hypothetical protein